MIPNIRVVAAFAITVIACKMALGQESSGKPSNRVVVTGRLEYTNHAPIAYTGITFRNLRRGTRDDFGLATDGTGAFSFDAEAGADYDVSLQAAPISLGELEVAGGYDVSMGTILLEFFSENKAILRSEISVKIASSQALSPKQRPTHSTDSATIEAIYLSPSRAASNSWPTSRVHIFLSDGKEIQPPMLKEQISVSSPQISKDGVAVGWLADYENCCTSYPLSLGLILYRPGKSNCVFAGDGRAIFDWRFLASGKQVVFYQDFPHGTSYAHYELHDVATCRLLDHYDNGDNDPDDSSKSPAWVNELGGSGN